MNPSKKRFPKPQSLAALAKSLDLNRECASALERVVALWNQGGGEDDSEELMKALDILAIAHIAASFDCASGTFS